jgi:hypothetical protein
MKSLSRESLHPFLPSHGEGQDIYYSNFLNEENILVEKAILLEE